MDFRDKEGILIPAGLWLDLIQDASYRDIRHTVVAGADVLGQIYINTTWLGFDLSPIPGSRAVFETVARTSDGGVSDVVRTDCIKSALAWHEIIFRENFTRR